MKTQTSGNNNYDRAYQAHHQHTWGKNQFQQTFPITNNTTIKNQHNKNRYFGVSFLNLLRFTTGEGWGQFMYDSAHQVDGCVDDPPFDSRYCGFNDDDNCIPLNGCSDYSIIPYMVLYTIIINFVFLSVFISVILNNYQEANEGAIRPEDFEAFAEHWAEFDPEKTCYIDYDQLEEFVATLFVPLGFKKIERGDPENRERPKFTRRQYRRRVEKIRVCQGRKIHFNDALEVLSVAHFERKAKWADGVVFEIVRKTRGIEHTKKELEEISAKLADGGISSKSTSSVVSVLDSATEKVSKAVKKIPKLLKAKPRPDVDPTIYDRLPHEDKNKAVIVTVAECMAADLIKKLWILRKERKAREAEEKKTDMESETESVRLDEIVIPPTDSVEHLDISPTDSVANSPPLHDVLALQKQQAADAAAAAAEAEIAAEQKRLADIAAQDAANRRAASIAKQEAEDKAASAAQSAREALERLALSQAPSLSRSSSPIPPPIVLPPELNWDAPDKPPSTTVLPTKVVEIIPQGVSVKERYAALMQQAERPAIALSRTGSSSNKKEQQVRDLAAASTDSLDTTASSHVMNMDSIRERLRGIGASSEPASPISSAADDADNEHQHNDTGENTKNNEATRHSEHDVVVEQVASLSQTPTGEEEEDSRSEQGD